MILQVSQSRASSIIWLPPCTSWRLRVRHPEFLDHCEAPFGIYANIDNQLLMVSILDFRHVHAVLCWSFKASYLSQHQWTILNQFFHKLSQEWRTWYAWICRDWIRLKKIFLYFLAAWCTAIDLWFSMGKCPAQATTVANLFPSTRRRAGKWECIQGTSFQCRKR